MRGWSFIVMAMLDYGSVSRSGLDGWMRVKINIYSLPPSCYSLTPTPAELDVVSRLN